MTMIGFQFPTGWNSTDARSFFLATAVDSFNSQRDGILRLFLLLLEPLSLRFNSQRDGILPALFWLVASYQDRFNSQRDGILH